jgi:hypothetical protein
VQSLLFDRSAGWTVSKATAWAKSHGYRYGKVHVTDQYVRLRQFDPKGLKVKRTIPFGRGIRAVIAREESMATTSEARRPRRKKPAAAARKPRRRRAKETAATEARKPRRRSTTRRSPRRTRAEAPRRRRRAQPAGYMMEARKPRRRPRRRTAEAWHGNRPGHRKAAKKGWERRRRKGTARRRARETVYEARRPRRRRAREAYQAQAPRRRRRRMQETGYVASPRRRRRHAREGLFEARRGERGMAAAELAVAVISGGLGFVLADGLDRWLATYDPASTAAKPTDKFTSDGAGTLANTLNVAASPNWMRLGAGAVATGIPAVASIFVEHPFLRASLEGAAVGAGVNLFKLLWNNVLMPLLAPKDTSTAALQKSFIARLYPAEIAAHINLKATPPQTAVSSAGSGALSGAPAGSYPQPGVGAPDVGPFALAAESPYPDAAQALRQQAGMGQPQFPTLQNVWGTGVPAGVAEFPTAAQAMGVGAVFDDIAKTVAAAIPGVTPHQAVQAAAHVTAEPFNLVAALARALPHIQTEILHECARHVHPHAARMHAVAPSAASVIAPAAPPTTGTHGLAAAAPGPQPTGSSWQPGPPSLPGPGPQPPDTACGCIGDDNPFLGFVGDAEESDSFVVTKAA